MNILLRAIMFDAGTQVRASLDQDYVDTLAEVMTAGTVLPPIVLFHDGNHYYIGDGFHRFMAAQRLQREDIKADVRPGSQSDALWYALGANKTHGKNMTKADKRHAILLALKTWPDRSGRQIAEQIGCAIPYLQRVRDQVLPREHLDSPARVTGKDGKRYPAKHRPRQRKADTMLDSDDAAPIVTGRVSSRTDRKIRYEQARQMASDGYTTRQMAKAFGVGLIGLRVRLRQQGIDVPADRIIGKSKHHNADRIVNRMVEEANNLTADVNLIEFQELSQERLPEWISELTHAKKALESFIRTLKELETHGEAA